MVRHAILLVTLMVSLGCTKKVVDTTVSPAPDSATTAQLAIPVDGAVGAPTGQAAVEAFLAAVKTQNLRNMSAMWGNDKGLTAERIARDELEKRLIVMQCMLYHDRWKFSEDQARLITGGRQEYLVTLWQKSITGSTRFTTVMGKGGRWFVEDIDLAPMKEFCR